MTTIVIDKFSGTEEAWGDYFQAILTKASTATALHSDGFVGHILTAELYKSYSTSTECPAGRVFHLLPEPGEKPTVVDENWKLWEYDSNRKTRESTELLLFRTAFEDSLDPISKKRMSEGLHKLRRRSLVFMMSWLLERYGGATTTTLKNNLAKFKEVFVDNGTMSVETYISECHEDPFEIAKQSGNTIAETTRVSDLTDGLEPCGTFREVFTHYVLTYQTPKEQRFDVLVNLIIKESQRLNKKTSGGSGHVNQVTRSEPSLSLQSLNTKIDTMVDTFTSALNAFTAAAAVQQQQSHATEKKTRGAQDVCPLPFYCWTHGPNRSHGHGGKKACKYPQPGHQATATWANKMGGVIVPTTYPNK
eukprot:gene28685-35586_t